MHGEHFVIAFASHTGSTVTPASTVSLLLKPTSSSLLSSARSGLHVHTDQHCIAFTAQHELILSIPDLVLATSCKMSMIAQKEVLQRMLAKQT